MKKLLSDIDFVSLTTDTWTSKATRAFATTTAHFINDEWELVSYALETIKNQRAVTQGSGGSGTFVTFQQPAKSRSRIL